MNVTEYSVCGGNAALCQITLTTYYYYYYHFLPSVAYDPEGFQKLDQLQKNYKISWNDLPPHQQQSSHEVELR